MVAMTSTAACVDTATDCQLLTPLCFVQPYSRSIQGRCRRTCTICNCRDSANDCANHVYAIAANPLQAASGHLFTSADHPGKVTDKLAVALSLQAGVAKDEHGCVAYKTLSHRLDGVFQRSFRQHGWGEVVKEDRPGVFSDPCAVLTQIILDEETLSTSPQYEEKA
ncbi:unnamed protein product [Toxocara canis]|uniref:Proteinase inhibitor n=1 Tax=Toxocara canis TaxID=6265 RepID=A0A183U0W9_TOXCA|nr:unnamed protein product [Toxocara canis]